MPLAERMRPRTLDEFVGQEHVLARGKPLPPGIAKRALPPRLHSLVVVPLAATPAIVGQALKWRRARSHAVPPA